MLHSDSGRFIVYERTHLAIQVEGGGPDIQANSGQGQACGRHAIYAGFEPESERNCRAGRIQGVQRLFQDIPPLDVLLAK